MTEENETLNELLEMVGDELAQLLRDLVPDQDALFDWFYNPVEEFGDKTPYEIFTGDKETRERFKQELTIIYKDYQKKPKP